MSILCRGWLQIATKIPNIVQIKQYLNSSPTPFNVIDIWRNIDSSDGEKNSDIFEL